MWEICKEQKAQNSALLLVTHEGSTRKPQEPGLGLGGEKHGDSGICRKDRLRRLWFSA